MDENQNKPVTDAGKKPDEKPVAPTEKPAAVSASAATQPVAQSATPKSAPEKKPENVQSQPASSGPIDRTISSPSRTLVGDEPSGPSQKEVSSEKDRIDDEAQATRKRKPRKHTWYNSRPFIFACVIVLYVSALIGMVFIDTENIITQTLSWFTPFPKSMVCNLWSSTTSTSVLPLGCSSFSLPRLGGCLFCSFLR
jgi:cobalamin biosynthesis Mg chelatase CobN